MRFRLARLNLYASAAVFDKFPLRCWCHGKAISTIKCRIKSISPSPNLPLVLYKLSVRQWQVSLSVVFGWECQGIWLWKLKPAERAELLPVARWVISLVSCEFRKFKLFYDVGNWSRAEVLIAIRYRKCHYLSYRVSASTYIGTASAAQDWTRWQRSVWVLLRSCLSVSLALECQVLCGHASIAEAT